ncbi:MAG: class I SAM-dependent methyltransferase [Syntrophobacteraceae bacterium]|jgi:2-polyprenyl-3-methyl-5-hydroxy-6-metoxy-1,4-benzoquinol methylase
MVRESDYESKLFATDPMVYPSNERSSRSLKIQRSLGALRSLKCAKVLDYGCGGGAITRTVSRLRPDIEMWGCDISHAALSKAKDLSDNVHYFYLDESGIRSHRGFFNAVLALDVIEHLREPSMLLENAKELLLPHGIIHLHVPCEGQPYTVHWLMWKLGILADVKEQVAGHIQRFTHRSICSLIEEHGFRITHIEYQYHPIGQIVDYISFTVQSLNSQSNQDLAQMSCIKRDAVRLITSLPWYRVMPTMEAASYIESKILARSRIAMGVDVTAIKR